MNSSEKILIDTDVLIDYLKGVDKAVEFIEEALVRSKCCISVITIAELNVGIRNDKEKNILSEFLEEFHIENCTLKIAEVGGLFRKNFGKSHGLGLADALIIATAKAVDAKLISLNAKHFSMFDNVILPYKK